ncbi:cobalt-precorrin-6A reductase [Paracoccus sp. (in: a-proteobacteria)]|uniref:cobalt-precorrin-6A reductase n=1 Tax=Paracoccus sp. TaxID=267 RepID=UPI0026DEBF4B|nr:cobalt-precorrin-6A reductase [Paracoccus sp. (in: a-proteobacteria)]MDO5371692.1 cobalt-precorrin-6A reductase [Paracoccus sp. (in: a-proteobacteria)]
MLGGTTEASRLAQAVAEAGWPALLSYAGRVANPRAQPVPVHIGGFGGPEGLAAFLQSNGIGQVIDATHPFAARISRNALQACALAEVPLCAFERAAWTAGPQDNWTHVPDIAGAAAALDGPGKRVFLAIGRQHLADFAHLAQHRFLTRLVDVPARDFPLPNAEIVVARGPFRLEDDLDLMRAHGTELLVAKNAGGAGAEAKILAARTLGIPVIMIDRPGLPERPVRRTVAEVMDWLHARLGV